MTDTNKATGRFPRAAVYFGDALSHYKDWPSPKLIFADGPFGVTEEEVPDAEEIRDFYRPHVDTWTRRSTAGTSLLFWGSAESWAAVHPLLVAAGWTRLSLNVWDRGSEVLGSTRSTRSFPEVSEFCAHYAAPVVVDMVSVQVPKGRKVALNVWLRAEWTRAKLTLKAANEVCSTDRAARRWLAEGEAWRRPPTNMFSLLVHAANKDGAPEGAPYFGVLQNDGSPMLAEQYAALELSFVHPNGVTNVWAHRPTRPPERWIAGEAIGQKPADMTAMLLRALTREEDVVWEPFGGLFTASLTAQALRRTAYGAERDAAIFDLGVQRFKEGFQVPADVPQVASR